MAELGTVYVDVKADYDSFGKRSKKAFLGIGKSAAGAFAGAFAAYKVVDFFGDTISAASDLEESINAVNVTFEEAADGVLALGENSAEAFGLSQSEFNAFAVQFSAFAQQVAGDGGDVVGTVEDITTRVADFASVMNLDVAEAAQIFQSSLAGQTEPIRRFGVDMSAAAVQAHALAEGIWDGEGAMTESEKVTARYSLLMAATAKTAGDFANTSDSLANKQRIAAAEFENAKAAIGEALLPIMAELTGFVVDKVIPALEELGPAVQATIDWVVEAWEWLQEKLQPVFDWIVETINWVRSWWEKDSDTIVSTTQGLWQDIQPILEAIGRVFTTTFEAVQLLIERFIQVVSYIWENFGDHILRLAQAAWDFIRDIIKAALQVIQGLLDTFIGIVTLDWERAWEGIKSFLDGIWDTIVSIVELGFDVILELFSALWGWIWDRIKDIPGKVRDWAFDVVTSAVKVIKELPGMLANFASDAARAFIDKLKGFLDTVKNTVKSVFVDAPLAIIGKGWLWGSPSKVMIQLGEDITEGLVIGINERKAQDAIKGLLPPIDDLTGAVDDLVPGQAMVTNHFHGPVGGSMTDFAKTIMEEAAMDLRLAYG